MANLFKDSMIKDKLADFEIPEIENKISIIQNWLNAYNDKSLHKKTETECEQAFNNSVFVEVLGYITFPNKPYTINPKDKTETKGGQKPDASLGYFDNDIHKVNLVCEIKDVNTDIDKPQKREGILSPIQQAFKYKPQYSRCKFVLATNFYKIRLLSDNQLDYEEWTLDDLVKPDNDYFLFRKFYYLLCSKNIVSEKDQSITEKLLTEVRIEQKKITDKFYDEYKKFRLDVINDIKNNNQNITIDFAIEKAQKIIDRVVFIAFCEDIGLLPENGLTEQVEYIEKLIGVSIWEGLKGFFKAIDKGNDKIGIPKGYNGGLFENDNELNNLKISDTICKRFVEITQYNFSEDLTVNILGHIFEQSISDLEELKSNIKGDDFDKKKSKRKKEGVYYTPEYITGYIVENTIGKWLEDRLEEAKKKYSQAKKDKELRIMQEYQTSLQHIKVLDPACGSGAFLVQAFDYLYNENKRVIDLLNELDKDQMRIFDNYEYIKQILQNNLYGVDLNPESVEITKLSLWLKTAQKDKKLTALDNNIKCGNSLIDDPEVAGDKAFKWEEEFPYICSKTSRFCKIRIETRMPKVSEKDKMYDNIILTNKERELVAKTITKEVKENKYKLFACTIMPEYIIMIVQMNKDIDIDRIFDNILYDFKIKRNGNHIRIDRNKSCVTFQENIYEKIVEVQKIHKKHSEKWGNIDNTKIDKILKDAIIPFTGIEDFRYLEGRFDCVIGNPPYVNIVNIPNKERNYLKNKYLITKNKVDLYAYFIELIVNKLLIKNGIMGYIISNTWLATDSFLLFRKFLLENGNIEKLCPMPLGTFVDAVVETIILIYNIKENRNSNAIVYEYENDNFIEKNILDIFEIKKSKNIIINPIINKKQIKLIKKIELNQCLLGDIIHFSRGVKTSNDKKFIFKNKRNNDCYKLLRGRDIKRYSIKFNNSFLWYRPDLMKEKKGCLVHTKDDFLQPEKIILQGRSGKKIISHYDCEQYFVLDTAYYSTFLEKNNHYLLKFILSIMNSFLINFWYGLKFKTTTISGYELHQIPIPSISLEKQTPFIEKAETMLNLNKKLNDKKQSFFEWLENAFDVNKISKKLSKMEKLSKEDFTKELKKAKVDVDSMKIFNQCMDVYKEVIEIKSEIDKTDREIDNMVYELYGLTDEEIKIVEESV